MKVKIQFLLLLFFFISNITLAKSINICASCKHSTIQSGVDVAVNGDQLKIQAGIYKENNIVITHSIDIIGEGEVIVDGENKATVFNFQTDSFSISGLHIINIGHSFTKDYAAILVSKSNHFSIKNNILENVFFGILIEKSKGGIVEGNKVSSKATDEASSGNGIHVWHSKNMLIKNNEVHHLRDGIYFEFVSKSKIKNNYSHNNIRYGLHFMFSNKDNYYDNTFENNGAGVAVMFSKHINMKRNIFKNNGGPSSYGLLLKEIYDAEIINNKFIKNTTGITADGSTRINYKENDFSNNGWAIKFTGACYENIFIHNNFFNNSFDLSYNSQLNNNKFESNYWSAYTGYDLDKNGIGDVPFRPVKLFSYIVNKTPESIVLLRSLFVDIINFSEKVSPVFTPDKLKDKKPLMKPYRAENDLRAPSSQR